MPEGVLVDIAEPSTDGAALPPSRDQRRPVRMALRSEQDADEDLSHRVKKRIGKLTARTHEAEQKVSYWQRKAMENDAIARRESDRARVAEERLVSASKVGADFYYNSVAREVQMAEEALAAATADGDPAKIAAASRKLGQATAREREVERMKADADAEPAPEPRQVAPQPQPPAAPQRPSFTPRTAEWMQENAGWYKPGTTDPKTVAAQGFHQILTARGIDPATDEDEYFENLDRLLADEFPEDYEEKPARSARRPAREDAPIDDEIELRPTTRPERQPTGVAPVRRGQAPRDAAPSGKVRLSEDQLETARSMGVSPEAYARNLVTLRQQGRIA